MRFKKLYTTVVLFVAAMFVFASVSTAQQSRFSKRDVGNTISKLERSSNTFRRDFDKYLDQSSINGTNEEDRINRIVSNYEAALDSLRREFDRNDNWWQSRNNVRGVMEEARAVNVMMNNLTFARKLENQWRNMRRDINELADKYELPALNTSGTGGGNAPNWAVGTFFGRNPRNGDRIQITINENGSVTAEIGGAASFGTLSGTLLDMGTATARVSRLNNGIRTSNTETGETIDYYRNYDGGDWNSNDGKKGDVPNWAVGTFYGRNPQNGGNITLTIQDNGNVTVNMDGNVSYGSLYRSTFTVNAESANVTRISNGIRMTNNRTGERIDYSRSNSGGTWNDNNVQMGDVPSWAVGTFYGRNPQTGGNITLTVQSSGSVTVNMDGAISYGSMYKSTFTAGGETASVKKISNGFRMTNNRTGERIDYRRQ